MAKLVPMELKMTLRTGTENFQGACRASMSRTLPCTKLIDMALKLEGMPRHASTHAAGVVITSGAGRAVMCRLPTTMKSVVTQFTMTTLEELGLLKMDFLGLRTLTVIDDAVKNGQAA